MKFILAIIITIILPACSFFPQLDRRAPLEFCLHPQQEQLNTACELTPWVDYWLQVSTLHWKERQTRLAKLSNTPVDTVKMILLSHVPNTPYQSRLRAQLVAQSFVEGHKSKLAKFIRLIVFLPAQEKLELESALATQTQFNIGQEKHLQEQRKQLTEQELQINRLLQIEKSIIKKPSEAKL